MAGTRPAAGQTAAATTTVGPGPASDPAAATPLGVPGAPTGLTATPGDSQVVLAWNPPATDGGDPTGSWADRRRDDHGRPRAGVRPGGGPPPRRPRRPDWPDRHARRQPGRPRLEPTRHRWRGPDRQLGRPPPRRPRSAPGRRPTRRRPPPSASPAPRLA